MPNSLVCSQQKPKADAKSSHFDKVFIKRKLSLLNRSSKKMDFFDRKTVEIRKRTYLKSKKSKSLQKSEREIKERERKYHSIMGRLKKLNMKIKSQMEETKLKQKQIFSDRKQILQTKLKMKLIKRRKKSRKHSHGTPGDERAHFDHKSLRQRWSKTNEQNSFRTNRDQRYKWINKMKDFITDKGPVLKPPILINQKSSSRKRSASRRSGEEVTFNLPNKSDKLKPKSMLNKPRGESVYSKKSMFQSQVRKSVRRNTRMMETNDFSLNDYLYKLRENPKAKNIKETMNEYNNSIHPFIINKHLFDAQYIKGDVTRRREPEPKQLEHAGQVAVALDSGHQEAICAADETVQEKKPVQNVSAE